MTDHKILKYVIPVRDEYTLNLPVSSKILSVAEQRNTIVIYAMVAVTEENMSKKDVKILIKGTGHLITESIGEYRFLGTVNLHGGALMFHVFCKE